MENYKFDIMNYDPINTFAFPANQIISDLWSNPGKKTREKIVGIFSRELNIDQSYSSFYSWAVESIHAATLLHDDVIDCSKKRRGEISANEKYSNRDAILSGDQLIAYVMNEMINKAPLPVLKSFGKILVDLCDGEVRQNTLIGKTPTDINELKKIAELKTASLFRFCALAPTIHSNTNLSIEKINLLFNQFGFLFQFIDDWKDFYFEDGKEKFNDLRERRVNMVHMLLLDYSRESKLITRQFMSKQEGFEITKYNLLKTMDTNFKNQVNRDIKKEFKLLLEKSSFLPDKIRQEFEAFVNNFKYLLN